MEHDVMERLRAARPRVDDEAFDADLLARVREQPIEARARRTVPRVVAVPVAAGVTLTVAGVVMLAGGPGDVGGPSSASAITQALHWLDPGADQILHARSIETQDGRTTTREVWQSSDDPADQRLRIEDAGTYGPPAKPSMTRRPTRSTTARAPPRVMAPVRAGTRRCRPATRSSRRCGSCSAKAT